MSDQDYGVLLHDANDVLPLGLAGTPWEIIYNALRDVLKSGVGASDSGFMRKACALYFLARGDLDAVTDRCVLNGVAAALALPYWVENFVDPKQASAIIYHWIKYKPTRANLTALALASGMRAFRLRETYTSTEYGLSHSFGFDLGEGYDTSFFAGPNAEPGLATAQRICGALTHFFLRIKDSPTLIVDVTYPAAPPSGWPFYFRADQSEIRVLQGYNWDLYDADGNLAMLPDEYAVVEPVAVRDTYGVNTEVVAPSRILIVNGQIRLSWSQSPVSAYALFANVSINIPGMLQTWPSLSHVDVNLPPNAIPGSPLFDGMDDRIFGEGWSIFAAYDSHLNRLDINDLYLVGGVDLSPVYLRANRYATVCSVWLSYTPPPPPPLDDRTTFIVVDETTGTIVHSIVDEGLVYGEVGYVLMDEAGNMITVYETGVQTEPFYFTANGRNETANTSISHSDIPVYLEDGTAPAADTPYDGSVVLAFMDVDGNTKQADGESLYVDNGVLRLDAPDTDEGEQWAALVEYIEPAPTLPTVEITNGLAVVGSSADYCYSRSFVPIYDSSQNRILYDSTKSYVVQIGNGSGTIWGIEFFCASDSSGYLVAWNRTNVTLLVLGASIYSCSSNSAYRVIVSDSSNVKYPAFAYDLSGATYYYVCDGVQTDWTDDLSTIGYSLVTGSEAYLTSLGSSETTDTLIGNSSFYLYSSSGASLYGNQSKKYVLIGQFLKDGTNVTNDGMDSRLTTGMNCSAVNVSSSTSSLNKLMLAGTLYSYNAFRITYLEV